MSKEEIKEKIKRSMHEVRTITAKVQVRTIGEGDDAQQVIEGYALKFNQWSNNLGFWVPVIERIMPNALDNADMSDVKCLFNHNADMPLGRNTVQKGQPGNLQLNIDNIGLHYRCVPTDTSFSRDLIANIQAGVVNQCSFAFELPDDSDNPDVPSYDVQYNEDTGTYEATVNRFKAILDVSPVTFPAYDDTEVAVGERCANKIENLISKRKKREEHQDQSDDNSLFFNLAKINYLERERRK